MNLQYSGEPGSSLELEETAPTLEKLRHPKRIPVKCRQRNRFIPAFLIGVAVLSLVSLLYLGIDWGKMASRIPDIGVVFWDLAHLDFSNMDLIFSSLVETVSIAVLSLLYSLVLGVVFGMLAARNVFRVPVLSVATQALFTFLRAVPTPVWVLLMLVCLGMGPEAGVAGLCVHTTAFFTKSFAQSFESIPEETIEALEGHRCQPLEHLLQCHFACGLFSDCGLGGHAPGDQFFGVRHFGHGRRRRHWLCDFQLSSGLRLRHRWGGHPAGIPYRLCH